MAISRNLLACACPVCIATTDLPAAGRRRYGQKDHSKTIHGWTIVTNNRRPYGKNNEYRTMAFTDLTFFDSTGIKPEQLKVQRELRHKYQEVR